MKKIIIVTFAMLLSSIAFSQKLTYSEVVAEKGTVKELYNRALMWYGETYNSSNDVIQTRIIEEDKGIIIAKALFKYNSKVFSGGEKVSGIVKYTVKIIVKEGRYKYIITDFYHKANKTYHLGLITTNDIYEGEREFGVPQNWYNKVYKDIKKQCELNTIDIISSLKKGMSKENSSSDDNW